jgi:hypothetical protein
MSDSESLNVEVTNELENYKDELADIDSERARESLTRVLKFLRHERLVLNGPVLRLTETQPVDQDDTDGSASDSATATLECPSCKEDLTVSLSD